MRSTIAPRFRLTIPTALALAMVATGAGCSTEQNGQVAAANSNDVVATSAKEALANLYGPGTSTAPASDGPPAQPGRKIALVIASQQNPTGTKIVKAAREATDAIGWDLTIYDGKYEPAEYQEGIRQAIVQNADAIWLEAIDCPVVRTALAEAKQAGVPVVAHESADCSDVDPEAESYFARSLQFAEGDFLTWSRALGEAQAVWLLGQQGEKTDVIEFSVPELVVTQAIHDGFDAAMNERCPSCQVTTVEVRTSEFGPPLQQKVATAILKNPDANAIAFSYDDVATAGGASGVMESGRADSLAVVGGSSFAPTIDLIRKTSGLDAGFVYDENYLSWTTVDAINRLLAGADPARDGGPGLAVIDRDNGLPPAGEDWVTNIDYRSAFNEVWGVR